MTLLMAVAAIDGVFIASDRRATSPPQARNSFLRESYEFKKCFDQSDTFSWVLGGLQNVAPEIQAALDPIGPDDLHPLFIKTFYEISHKWVSALDSEGRGQMASLPNAFYIDQRGNTPIVGVVQYVRGEPLHHVQLQFRSEQMSSEGTEATQIVAMQQRAEHTDSDSKIHVCAWAASMVAKMAMQTDRIGFPIDCRMIRTGESRKSATIRSSEEVLPAWNLFLPSELG